MIALAIAFPLVRLPLSIATGGSIGPVFGFSPLRYLGMLIDRWWAGQVVDGGLLGLAIAGLVMTRDH
jgi:hypothetical protein